MDFGTSDIQNIIYQHLVDSEANVKGGRSKVAKDTAKEIYDYIEEMVKNKPWNVMHGFSPEAESILQRLEKGLGFNLMQKTPVAHGVYLWIISQEKQGYSLDRWMRWAMAPERADYVGKYRNDPRHIQADWPQAFIVAPGLQGPVYF